MKLDKQTIEFIKDKIELKLNKSKSNGGFYNDEERALIDGKELAFEEIIDDLNELITNK